ncbi:MAG: GNAT family N-acyltransferase [Acidobacteriota bacterium]
MTKGCGMAMARVAAAVRPELPAAVQPGRRYEVRFARGEAELDAVFRLRFEVFNLELGEGLQASYATGRDVDEYDAGCHHLIVAQTEAPDVPVGTYRMQTSEMAAAHRGFYSASEFDLSTLPASLVDHAVEVGRACVAAPHRNTSVLFLLWKGLAQYVAFNGKRYLFGCCSVSTTDEAYGWRVYRHLQRDGHVDARWTLAPRPGCALDPALSETPDDAPVSLPPLMRLYLRYGGRVIGAPAIDRRFATIDFFVVFDVAGMEPERYRRFFGDVP